MSIEIPKTIAQASDYEPLINKDSRYGETVSIKSGELTDEMLDAILAAAQKVGEKRTERVVTAIIAMRAGDDRKAIPNLRAAPEMILAYLRRNLHDGWLYKRGIDGHLHAWLVTSVKYHEPRNDGNPYVTIGLTANSKSSGYRERVATGLVTTQHSFTSESLTRKRVSDALTKAGFYIETPDLRAEYDTNLRAYEEVLAGGFAEQYRFTGAPISDGESSWRTPNSRAGRKVIHDLAPSEVAAPTDVAPSMLYDPVSNLDKIEDARKRNDLDDVVDSDDPDSWGRGPVPTQFMLRVFDLHAHDFLWVNALDCERYVYDPALRDKIVLPDDQRNLLDILTSNLSDFTADVIEGKSAGNVILGKGVPGVGKTLTAEVYSELIERPLYSIHSGNLGVTADKVRENLEETFERAQRWNAVLLLDEADVFVLERGENITQNAIVAEFLRTLEYFTGLMFMTTNRANNIDDAILSRAAAIIDYELPDKSGIRKVWEVQAANNGITLNGDLLDTLVDGFVTIAPRDVKMLLRLALRLAKGNGHDLDVETFHRCATFRGLHFRPGSRKGD